MTTGHLDESDEDYTPSCDTCPSGRGAHCLLCGEPNRDLSKVTERDALTLLEQFKGAPQGKERYG